jgi:hypothetical protein
MGPALPKQSERENLGNGGGGMKRYIIFAAIGPLVAGFFLLVLGAPAGYWGKPDVLAKLFMVVVKTVPYNYLFGIIPALMIGAVDDILLHVRAISPVLRMLLTGLVAFAATAVLYGTLGTETGLKHYVLYGLVGFVPATLSSWLAHKFDKEGGAQ